MARILLGLVASGGDGTLFAGTVASLLATVQANPGGHEFEIERVPAGLSPGRARDFLADALLRSDAAGLMIIESGLTFGPDAIDRLLGHDVPIVVAPYPTWEDAFERGLQLLPGDAPAILAGLREVEFAPAGFIWIRRTALEGMADAAIARQDFGRRITGFFDPVVVQDGQAAHLGEDWAFCQRARDRGLSVYCDFDLPIGRSGSYAYQVEPLPDGSVPIHEYFPVVDRLMALPSAALRPPGVELPPPIAAFVDQLEMLEVSLKEAAAKSMAEYLERRVR